jgi:hypothetical protein
MTIDNVEVLPSIESDIKYIDEVTQELRGLLPVDAPSDRVIERALQGLGDARSGLLYLSEKLNAASEKLGYNAADIGTESIDDVELL